MNIFVNFLTITLIDTYIHIHIHIASLLFIAHFGLLQVYLVGEYLCSWHDTRCTPDRIAAMFDALETLVYEVCRTNPTRSVGKSEHFSPRLLTAMMSALAKVSTRGVLTIFFNKRKSNDNFRLEKLSPKSSPGGQ